MTTKESLQRKLKNYHRTKWLPLSKSIDTFCVDKPLFLRTLKRLFDAHFDILALLGIIDPPRDDLACYVHLFVRHRNGKYRNLTYQERLHRCIELLRWVYQPIRAGGELTPPLAEGGQH